jgi:formamidopyrimidine-DNA glycosylase
MTGKKIVDARQQGKYFWLVMDSPPHPLMHLGMAGWMKVCITFLIHCTQTDNLKVQQR